MLARSGALALMPNAANEPSAQFAPNGPSIARTPNEREKASALNEVNAPKEPKAKTLPKKLNAAKTHNCTECIQKTKSAGDAKIFGARGNSHEHANIFRVCIFG